MKRNVKSKVPDEIKFRVPTDVSYGKPNELPENLIRKKGLRHQLRRFTESIR